jgi:hypothetical protein
VYLLAKSFELIKMHGKTTIKDKFICKYNITPLIRINLEDKPYGYARNPDN